MNVGWNSSIESEKQLRTSKLTSIFGFKVGRHFNGKWIHWNVYEILKYLFGGARITSTNHRPIKKRARHPRLWKMWNFNWKPFKIAKQLKFCLGYWHWIHKLFAQTNNYFRFRSRLFRQKECGKVEALLVSPSSLPSILTQCSNPIQGRV